MRRWFLCLCLIGLSCGADAADFGAPPLRGSYGPEARPYGRWSGLYGGGQIGYGTAEMDFTGAFNGVNIFDSSTAFTSALGSVSSWAAFGSDRPAAISYGAFVGFNSQWEDAVLGVEVNYNHTSLKGQSSDSRCYSEFADPQCSGPLSVSGTDYNATVNATASARLTDYATFRARAGWAYGNIMPYAMAGVALGRVETTRTATATATEVSGGPGQLSAAQSVASTRYPWGFMAGAGIEFLLLPNVFVRAEYEFVRLENVTNIDLDLNTVRFGAGVRF
jgi:outer membrane immunogenic protein